jgi:hypothetical protein
MQFDVENLMEMKASYRKSNKMQVYQNFISCLYEAQHVLGDTTPIIRSVYTLPDSVQQLHIQLPTPHAKPEAASAVLGS